VLAADAPRRSRWRSYRSQALDYDKSPLWVAHTQHDYARMLLRREHLGDRKHALALLDAALATADRLGLKALAYRAQQLKRETEAAAA
jgi:hypothetical protein